VHARGNNYMYTHLGMLNMVILFRKSSESPLAECHQCVAWTTPHVDAGLRVHIAWHTSTSVGNNNFYRKSNYFRFTTITLNFMWTSCTTLLIDKASDYHVSELEHLLDDPSVWYRWLDITTSGSRPQYSNYANRLVCTLVWPFVVFNIQDRLTLICCRYMRDWQFVTNWQLSIKPSCGLVALLLPVSTIINLARNHL